MVDAWTDDAFRHAAEAWTRDRLADQGIRVTGEIGQPHVRWWSTVLEVPISDGRAWFKAVKPQYAHELPLTVLLAGLRPMLVPEVLGVDAARGWMLLTDAGDRLRELNDGRTAVEHWEALLPQYAELQLAAAPHAAELPVTGVPDLRPAALPVRLAVLLEERELLALGKPGGLSPGEHAHLREHMGRFKKTCALLDELGIPATVQHDDLHDGNVFVRKYLEPWGQVADDHDLRLAADLARQTGTVQRSLAWARRCDRCRPRSGPTRRRASPTDCVSTCRMDPGAAGTTGASEPQSSLPARWRPESRNRVRCAKP